MNEALLENLRIMGYSHSSYELYVRFRQRWPQLNGKSTVWAVDTSSVTISTVDSVMPSLVRAPVRRKGWRSCLWRALGELLYSPRVMRRGWTMESTYKSPPIRTETIELQSFGWHDYMGSHSIAVQYHPASDTLYIKQ
jgi:hypothetical protein